jgi:hypothetical protein
MPPERNTLKHKREDLKTRRAKLFNRFERNPDDTNFAREINKLDDEISECTEQMVDQRRASRKKA